jgi:hypothetical protein
MEEGSGNFLLALANRVIGFGLRGTHDLTTVD